MLPFFFQHYDDLVDRYFIFDNGSTDGSLALLHGHGRVEVTHFEVPGDSFVEEERRLGDTMWHNSQADWVIVTDIDEHIYHPSLTAYLQRCSDDGITAIRSVGYEMVSDTFPDGAEPLVEQVTMGTRSIGHDRLCIFNPKEIEATNFTVGRHEAYPTGRVVWPDSPQVLLLHYKQLGADYPVVRSAELRRGLREGDIENKWGVHYTWSPEEIVAKWQELRDSAAPVPGLGSLKHVTPDQYFEDDRMIRRLGLFDDKWYLAMYPDVRSAGADAFSHYCNHGWREGRQPSFYFEPEWYCANYPEMYTEGRNPFCDYLERGERHGARPSPHFDPGWYRQQHRLSSKETALEHYFGRRMTGLVSPLPDFDVREYCRKHPDLLGKGGDPFETYFKTKVKASASRSRRRRNKTSRQG